MLIKGIVTRKISRLYPSCLVFISPVSLMQKKNTKNYLGTYIKMTRYIFWTEERFQISLPVIELNSLQEIYRGNEIVEMRDIFDF